MSGIAGCFNRDGRPVDRELLAGMLRQVAYRGPDSSAQWVGGEAGLAQAMLRTTPESLHERLPFFDESCGLAITIHGRIDNRGDLAGALALRGGAPLTDSALVLRAYERWGTSCPSRLVGDFAFAIWDQPRRMLFCARDPFGNKPFFYACIADSINFASEPRALLQDARLPARPNEAVVAEYLTGGPRSMGETLLRDVCRLPPAHFLVATRDAIRVERYWDFDLAREIRHGSDAEYAAHFLAVLEEALAAAMRSHRPVGIMLSGGLDSTSLVSLARCAAGETATHPLRCFSMSFPGSLCDETAFIGEVAAATGAASHIVPWTTQPPAYFAARAGETLDFPGYPNCDGVYAPLAALASGQGVRALLTGIGGDEGLSGSLYHYADMLKGMRFVAMLRQYAADRRLLGGDQRLAPVVHTQLMLLRQGLYPLFPARWRYAVKEALGRHRPHAPWLRREFAARVGLDERLRPARDGRKDGTFAQRHMADTLTRPGSIHEAELLERVAAAQGIELRSPFMDRRVLELALALPEEQRWRGAQTKVILREAMRGHLPEELRTRRTKADFSHMVAQSLCDLTAQGFWKDLESGRRGWVDGAALAEDAERLQTEFARGDDAYTRDFWPLWMAAGVELWIRGVATWRAPRTP